VVSTLPIAGGIMKATRWVLALALVIGCSGWLYAAPTNQNNDDRHNAQQDRQRDQDRDRAQDRDQDQNRAENAYYNNPNFKRGWNDALKHKRSNRRWKNDSDREAYMAGYAHGERGERWQNPNRRNKKHKRDRDDRNNNEREHDHR
jgi:hypothetical protein